MQLPWLPGSALKDCVCELKLGCDKMYFAGTERSANQNWLVWEHFLPIPTYVEKWLQGESIGNLLSWQLIGQNFRGLSGGLTITRSRRKVTGGERRRREKNTINSKHLVPWQRTQATRTNLNNGPANTRSIDWMMEAKMVGMYHWRTTHPRQHMHLAQTNILSNPNHEPNCKGSSGRPKKMMEDWKNLRGDEDLQQTPVYKSNVDVY